MSRRLSLALVLGGVLLALGLVLGLHSSHSSATPAVTVRGSSDVPLESAIPKPPASDLPPVWWTPKIALCARMSRWLDENEEDSALKRSRTQSAWCARWVTSPRLRAIST